MESLLVLIAFFVLVMLVLGLVRPALLRMKSRKIVVLLFGGLFLMLMFLIPNTELKTAEPNHSTQASQKAGGIPTPATPAIAKRQEWVMQNCPVGRSWDLPLFVENIGGFTEIPYTGNRASHIFKAFYFPDADMTVFYNAAKNTVATYTWGKKGDW